MNICKLMDFDISIGTWASMEKTYSYWKGMENKTFVSLPSDASWIISVLFLTTTV